MTTKKATKFANLLKTYKKTKKHPPEEWMSDLKRVNIFNIYQPQIQTPPKDPQERLTYIQNVGKYKLILKNSYS
jgi:hypothetical protein